MEALIVIETESEYEFYLSVVEEMTFSKNLTQEEKCIYKLLVLSIENYEAENFPMTSSEPC